MPNNRPGKSLLEDEVWLVLLDRYVRGETSTALGLEFGVSPSAIAWQARSRGYRKMDRPEAVYRWHRPPPIAAHEDRAVNLAFDLDPADPGGSAERAFARAARGVFRAAGEGRIEDCLKLSEAARSVVRTARVMGFGGGY